MKKLRIAYKHKSDRLCSKANIKKSTYSLFNLEYTVYDFSVCAENILCHLKERNSQITYIDLCYYLIILVE